MFYPIENQAELARLRSMMSPFMINIQKCLNPKVLIQPQRERVFHDVIFSVSPVVDLELLNSLNQIIAQPENTTLSLEQSALRQISLRFFRF